ncbi:MAG TPA: hypothetical protein QF710_04350 [Candidatus Nitrosopelagicus sp.]|jgi:hypothetical protein|nr:hypothetical protein [Candidatus Nitrosopelagicus sp.]
MLNQFFSLRNKAQPPKIGANTHVQNQLHSLEIEKDILTKTISRLYDDESGLSKIQRDRLLLRYQHQLGVIISRIEKLQIVSKHPDLGPLGEGLITLMDQKLSQLDQRLYELSSKIQISQNEKVEAVAKEIKTQVKPQTNIKSKQENSDTTEITVDKISQLNIPKIDNEEVKKKFEITTLTSVPKLDSYKQSKYDQMLAQLDSDVITPPAQPKKIKLDAQPEEKIITNEIKPEIPSQNNEEKIKPVIHLPEEPELDDDNDDIAEIKAKIMKTLSKIEQAEVD